MPYISPELRPPIQEAGEELASRILELDVKAQDGAFNYAVTSLLKSVYPETYFNFNRAIGVLECIKQEYYRRDVAPYENRKIEENGDV